jgi:hypothetical protein
MHRRPTDAAQKMEDCFAVVFAGDGLATARNGNPAREQQQEYLRGLGKKGGSASCPQLNRMSFLKS